MLLVKMEHFLKMHMVTLPEQLRKDFVIKTLQLTWFSYIQLLCYGCYITSIIVYMDSSIQMTCGVFIKTSCILNTYICMETFEADIAIMYHQIDDKYKPQPFSK